MRTDRLLYFDNIRNDETVTTGVRVYNALMDGQADANVIADYYELQRRLLFHEDDGDGEGTFWSNYIYSKIAESENAFSIRAENGTLDDTTLLLAAGDFQDLQELIGADWAAAAEKAGDGRPCVCAMPFAGEKSDRIVSVAEAMKADGGAACAEGMAEHYRRHFSGIIGKYRAFTWEGQLKGVEKPDPITFEELIGYERQQEQLIRNTQAFLKGKRANNVLLYGDMGTGKSSSVKALLNKFAPEGLRLVSIQKDKIFDITKIMNAVSGRGCRFIIFIDDLSFEETEIEYKMFKSILEGGVEVQADNILIYVTSNRRNLVKEMWSDRGENGEINVNDGIQERKSLSDRFGLTITFGAPSKALFQEIVKSMAKKEGLTVDEGKLLAEANMWDMRQVARSGRSAKQFITHMAGMEE